MDVGVRELKQHLSEYIERAARGEIIRITDRGHDSRALLKRYVAEPDSEMAER